MKIHSTSFILTFFAFLFLFSCKSERKLDEFQFLLGKWEGRRDEMTLHEIWKKESDSLFSGKGIVFSGKDTLFNEKLKLEINKNEIFYVATVPNHTAPISFKLLSSEKNSWTFENKSQDFPQTIIYRFVQPDSLHATIEGIDKGKPSKEEFYFKKIN